ncbi:hypothetical protein [Streptomyces violaceusniger]|nr:hypothetical protein [Streptomyces violaceusniger]
MGAVMGVVMGAIASAGVGDLPERLFHGGVAGLEAGQLILPHEPKYLDGCPDCEANRRGEATAISPLTQHQDRVYVCSDALYARHYASKWVLGDLYRVRPVGLVEVSDEDRFATWKCEAAEVVAVVERAVRMTDAERRRLFRRWTVADRVAAGFGR